MTFEQALHQLKNGLRVEREGWNGKGMYIFKIHTWSYTDETKVNTNVHQRIPFIAMKTAQDEIVPWLASQTDILAEDWRLF